MIEELKANGLVIKNLKKINILVGKNGVGKSHTLKSVRNYYQVPFTTIPEENIDIPMRWVDALRVLQSPKTIGICFDDADLGCHYSDMEMCWQLILDELKGNNKQVFVATHSYELIKALYNVVKNKKEEMVGLYRLKADKEDIDNIEVVDYSWDQFVKSFDYGFEVR